MSFAVKIVGVPVESGQLQITQGTKVLLPSGEELKGVHKIVLTAEVNDFWRAEIHCFAQVTDLQAQAFVHRPSLWQRLVGWARGL